MSTSVQPQPTPVLYTILPKDCTVTALTIKDGTVGTTLVHLSNGQAYEFDGLGANYDAAGKPAWRYDLRDGSGAATIVGPALTAADMAIFKAWCTKIGAIWNTLWDSAPVGIALDPTAAPAATPTTITAIASGGVAIATAAPATTKVALLAPAHVNKLAAFFEKLPAEAKAGVEDVERVIKSAASKLVSEAKKL